MLSAAVGVRGVRGPPRGVLGADIWMVGPAIRDGVVTMVGGDMSELYWEV